MKIEDFADIIGTILELHRLPQRGDDSERWLAMFQHCEVGHDGILEGITGRGDTPKEAIRDYAEKISGKHLVFYAFTTSRKEYDAPPRLT